MPRNASDGLTPEWVEQVHRAADARYPLDINMFPGDPQRAVRDAAHSAYIIGRMDEHDASR
jgi:hypothetical protein